MSSPLKDPLAGSPWSTSSTVAGFAQSPPNPVLLEFAEHELARVAGTGSAIDIGCGAGRNAIPLVRLGWHVFGVDLSAPMLEAAMTRAREEPAGSIHLALAGMDHLPARSAAFDLVIAHGIWNLARSSVEFRQGVQEAARVARSGAGLFVFTFSRNTLPSEAHPVAGESFVFTQFSGQPQCFLTEDQLLSELGSAGFTVDPERPLRELNRRPSAAFPGGGPPVIYEAMFRYGR